MRKIFAVILMVLLSACSTLATRGSKGPDGGGLGHPFAGVEQSTQSLHRLAGDTKFLMSLPAIGPVLVVPIWAGGLVDFGASLTADLVLFPFDVLAQKPLSVTNKTGAPANAATSDQNIRSYEQAK